jgi:hypothetical protein
MAKWEVQGAGFFAKARKGLASEFGNGYSGAKLVGNGICRPFQRVNRPAVAGLMTPIGAD